MKWIEIEVSLRYASLQQCLKFNPNNHRIVLSLYIHDAELAKIHHHDPVLRHSLDQLPQISSNELFMASSARHWKASMRDSQPQSTFPRQAHSPSTSDFALSGTLESISALVSEANNSTGTNCHELLTSWYTHRTQTTSKPSSWLNLLILWHSNFMALHANFDALECACGRDGSEPAQERIPYARAWVRSMNAKRCVLHAILLQNRFECLTAGAESAIHVPLCLFYCGIVWACFICFIEDDELVVIDAKDVSLFDELQLNGIDHAEILSKQVGALMPRKLALESLFRIINLMQCISYGNLSQSLASTLLALVEETQDLF